MNIHQTLFPSDGHEANPMFWGWPAVPETFTLYDKYSGKSVTLVLGETLWSPSIQGIIRKFEFLPGEVGLFQQTLVLLTQANFSPSSFYKFTYTLLRHWIIFLELLETKPSDIISFWDKNILTPDLAKAGKSILKLAARHSLGPWDTTHQKFIKKLNTRESSKRAVRKERIANRSKLLSTSSQADIIRLLDEQAASPNLEEWQIEGLTALALGFQHAIRPVQILTLLTNHIQLIEENDGKLACIVSFHQAKKKGGRGDVELSRSIKPEWAPLVIKLLNSANNAARTRIFSTADSTKLWALTKKVAKQFGVSIQYNYYKLRHTGAQTLADAGHSRTDIKNFLGQTQLNSGNTYLKSSRKQVEFLNKALGTSALYSKLELIATGKYVTPKELEDAHEDDQIAGIVGSRLIAGIGLCAAGQGNCMYDPVMSCYNCKKYMPVLDPLVHKEAIAGMREQVLSFFKAGGSKESPAYLQLTTAIAGAQRALDISNESASQK
ncbi:hypothetical protein [Massilia putida]|uniref:hypothetical protein n=1 Tax=Massilia putida TaxID=1141883 RepID=UPI0012EBF0F5|nr:hypothetical protein [Massilia putida]